MEGMEVVFRGYHDKDGHLVSADVLQIGKQKPITSVYDGERDLPVSEDFPASPSKLPVRIALCEVVFPDGKKRRPVIVDKVLEEISK